MDSRLALGGLVVARLLDQEGPARTPPSSPCRRRALLTGIFSMGIRMVLGGLLVARLLLNRHDEDQPLYGHLLGL